MFTGLIEEVGRVQSLALRNGARRLEIVAPRLGPELCIGDSVAVNGCCLTVVSCSGHITFDLLAETAARTNLPQLREGSAVNLERAMQMQARFGGHFVQGHVDCAARIMSFARTGGDFRLEIALPAESSANVVEKGSIAVDGISLTVAETKETSFVVWIIPHTREHTNLQAAQPGDLVNLEFDLLAKYVERLLPRALKTARAVADHS